MTMMYKYKKHGLDLKIWINAQNKEVKLKDLPNDYIQSVLNKTRDPKYMNERLKVRLDIFKDVVESTRALIDVKWEAGEKYNYLYSVIKTKKQEKKDGLNISDDGEEL